MSCAGPPCRRGVHGHYHTIHEDGGAHDGLSSLAFLNAGSTGDAPMSAMPRAKKSLGQHFLRDRNILEAIADAASVTGDDVVIEVGPGPGTLTDVLAERAGRVEAIELDAVLAAALHDRAPANVHVHEADAREVDVASLLGGCMPYKLLGNLPYYAAMPILRRFLEGACKPQQAVVMVQREVAHQMCAPAGDKSLLSVAVQLYGSLSVVRLVRPGSFTPPPKVTSAIVHIDVFDKPAEGIDNPNAFFTVVRAGFSAPRKQLRNSLANGLRVTGDTAEALLATAGIDPKRRAETLTLAEWASLYRARAGSSTSF